jgi:hypothetical protein
MVAPLETTPATQRSRRRWPLRWGVLLVAAGGLAPVGVQAYRVMFGSNFHTVVPGRIYRCSQPSAASVERMIADRGIRTIVNLRGSCDPFDWYLEEARAAHRHNICQEDISFSAGRLPSVSEVRRLILVLERTEYPIVLHCRRGADRTGLAAAVALLLTTATSLDDACRQLGWPCGHIALGRPAELDRFLDFYCSWLKTAGKPHSQETFRDWALNHYCPGSCWSKLAFAEPPPATASATEPTIYRLQVRNASLEPWTLNPQWTAGVHLGCHVYDDQDRLIDLVKTGLRDGVVKPGESTDFTVVVGPLHRPGRYRLKMDMTDEQQCWFFQTGSQPLELELTVRE